MDDGQNKPFMTNGSQLNGPDVLGPVGSSSDLEYCPKCGNKTLKKVDSNKKVAEESSAYGCENPDCKRRFEIVDITRE